MNLPLDDFKYCYFIGIGGIGMSAIARYFNTRKAVVSGYDREKSNLTQELEQEGISITYSDRVEDIPMNKIGNANDTLVVYTPAIPSTHPQLNWFETRGYTLVKRAHLLGWITRSSESIAIAGTHGKTTTTALVAHILKRSGRDISAFIGGISANYNTNFLVGTEDTVVVEADEFDRSFLQLTPDWSVITSTDPDHLDVYGNQDGVRQAFIEFAKVARKHGKLVVKATLPVAGDYTYSISEPSAHFYADQIKIYDGKFHFSLHLLDEPVLETYLQVPGFHNVENAVAAAALCYLYGIKTAEISTGIKTFKGVKRRFEIVLSRPEVILIDDYAHHPAEIRALLTSARAFYPGRKITIVFQPHLYSRTRDFYLDFATSLCLADRVLLTEIYPAREEKIEGISEKLIYDNMTITDKHLIQLTRIESEIKNFHFTNDVVILAGAGNISDYVNTIKLILDEGH